MKKLVLGIVGLPLLALGLNAIAQTVIVEEKPVMLMKQGDMYIVPEGTASTTNYYSYTDGTTKYVCTVTEPVELATVKGNKVKVKMSTDTKDITCYESRYFTLK